MSGLRAVALLASNKICNKNHLLHLVGVLFPHTTMLFAFKKICGQKISFQVAARSSKGSTNAHIHGHILCPEQPCQLDEY